MAAISQYDFALNSLFMTLQEAIALLPAAILKEEPASKWADLGCGEGLFTEALTALLPEGSYIHAVDKITSFPEIKSNRNISIQFHQADFVKEDLPLQGLDGILMANSLHYVPNKEVFLRQAKQYLSTTGSWIIIEYDSRQSNRWVPYPIPFEELKQLFLEEGYASVMKISERPSIYNAGKMYSAFISKKAQFS